MGTCNSSETDSDSDDPIGIIKAILKPGTEIENEARLLDLQMSIRNKIENRKISGSTTGISRQNIEIRDLSDGNVDDFFKKTVDLSNGPFGLLGKEKDCPLFFCNYDINQQSNYKIHSFNSNLLEETETILEEIDQKVKQDAEISLESNPSGLTAANNAINESRDLVRSEIENYLTSLSEQNVENIQNLVIEQRFPLRCRDPCGFKDGPKGPTLSQNAQLDIVTEQMLSSISNIYHEKIKEAGVEADQSVKVENTACILQMSIILVACIICLIIVWNVIKMMTS